MNSKTFGIPCSWPLRSLWCIPDSGQETPAFVRPSPCSNGPKMGMRAPKLTWRDNSHASSKSFGWDLWSGKRISHAAWEAVSLWLVQNGERTQHFLAFPTILSSPSAESMPTSGSAESTGQGNLVCCFPGTLEIKTHYQKTVCPMWWHVCIKLSGPSQTHSAYSVTSSSIQFTWFVDPLACPSGSLLWETLWGLSLLSHTQFFFWS